MIAGLLTSVFAAFATPATASAEETPANMYVRSDNTFYAYLAAGDNLDVSFTKVFKTVLLAGDVTVTVTSPDGVQQSCSVQASDPSGTACSLPSNLTSATAGVWQIVFDPKPPATAGVLDYYNWSINVQSGNTDIPGRVWSERYLPSQAGAATADFSLNYVSEQGFQYEAEYTGFNGVDSLFTSDAAGNTFDGNCISAYKSYDAGSPPTFPYGDEGQYDSPNLLAPGTCGDPYKIFFAAPAADLPTTASWPDGSTRWLKPTLALPDLTAVNFDQDVPTSRAGTFSVDVDNFTGQMAVQVDVNNDGDYNDPEDVELPLAIQNGTATVAWDGLDGQGNPVDPNLDLTARGLITQAGEIHFVNNDVETRGSLQVTAVNGPQANQTTLYWDDADLRTADRLCATPQLDGTGGVDSAGGVHGWPCFENANDGIAGSWGDTRYIDDWTYQTIAEELPITLPGLPELEIEKTSDATTETRIGDTVNYTVEITNNGPGDYTEQNLGRIQDDLSSVLDDATYNGDATASAGTVTFADPRLTWEGALAENDTVTITYSVELSGEGDLNVDNVAFQTICAADDPDCAPPPPPVVDCETNGVDPVSGLSCDPEQFKLPKLAVDKTADTTEIPAVGETVIYTVTAENVGTADYTAARPAVVVDDLTEVLDDATIDQATLDVDLGADPSYAAPTIKWVGELAVGQVVTITYEVTYTGEGDATLINVAFGPQCAVDDPNCDTPITTPECNPADANGNDPVTGEPCGRVRIPAAQLDVEKSVDPEDGSTVLAGQEMTYTVTFSNTGTAEADVNNWTDDLSQVLDDAEIVTDPAASDPDLSVSAIANDEFTVDGTVPVNESYTVTYTVRVLPDGDRGDNLLANFVFGDGVVPPVECVEGDPLCTVNPVPEIVDSKTVDPASGSTVVPGQELTYTLTFTNNGEGAGSVDKVDDLTRLLDDADITTAPATSDPALSVSEIADNRYAITGDLQPDQTVTVTYMATVKSAAELGDAELANFLIDPDEEPPVECEEVNEDCTTNPAPKITDTKSVDPDTGTTVLSGQDLVYTLTFTNSGKAAGPVDRIDDLTGLLDDAVVKVAPAASDPALSASELSDNRFAITGTLLPGKTVTVSYTVTVKDVADLGDAQLANFLIDPDEDPPAECEKGNEDCTTNPAPIITDSKSVDPETGSSVKAGADLTYTLTFTNSGAAKGAVDRVDDLTHVLDDATLTTNPEASDPALTVSEVADNRYAITGDLEPDQTVTVSYTVTVKDAESLGDSQLANFLMDPEGEPPTEPVCDGGEDCTFNPISNISVVKAADPESGTQLDEGQEVTYTLTFTNTGEGDGSVDYVDHMAGVLDDAEVTQSPTASDQALTVLDADDQFTVTGTLAAAKSVTVTYTVEVRDWSDQGDHELGNFVTVTGQEAPPTCKEGSQLCTEHPVKERPNPGPGLHIPGGHGGLLPNTGAPVVLAPLLAGLVLIVGGAGFLISRRRRNPIKGQPSSRD